MEPTQTDTTSNADAYGASGFGDRFRSRVAEVKAQLDAAEVKARERLAPVPGVLREAFLGAVGRVRDGLDLPSRSELSSLVARLDELDRKLQQREGRPASDDR